MISKRTIAVAGAGMALVVAGIVAAVILTPSGNTFCSEFVPKMEASSLYLRWAKDNKGEKDKWISYRTTICAGNTPTVPSLATLFGQSLVAAGKLVASPPTTTTDTTTTAEGVYLSATGSDANPCSQVSPCKTLQRGVTVAPANGTVNVEAGAYPGPQQIAGDARGVVVRAAGTVTMTGRLTLLAASNLTLLGQFVIDGADPYYDLFLDGCNQNVTVDGFHGQVMNVIGGNGITFRNIDMGGYSTPGKSVDSGITGLAGRGCGADPFVRNVTIENSRFHDVLYVPASQWGGAHPDCLEVNGNVNGLLISNTTFGRCGNTFLAFYTDRGDILNATVTASTFNALSESYFGIQWTVTTAGTACGNLVFRGNTYTSVEPPRFDCQARNGYQPILVEQNTFSVAPNASVCASSKAAGTIWRNNTYGTGNC